MDVRALFDKLLTELKDSGVREGQDDTGARLLVWEDTPFARLGHDERMAFLAIDDTVRGHADALALSEDVGSWVVVPADQVSQWESLAREALEDLRRRS